MAHLNRLRTQVLGLATLLFVARCAAASSDAGQATAAKPPAACSAYASIPLPAEAEKAPIPKTTPACASYRSYRGIGRPVDYSKARACAWQERLAQKADLGQNQQEPIAAFVGGSLILADIYFNGAGVQRNVPLAIRFACESEEGLAKLALPDVEKLNGLPRAGESFEFCDYAATTFSMDFCTAYSSEIHDDRRSHYYKSLKSSMTPEQEAAFEKLLVAQKQYVEAHASEVDRGGTIRGIRTIGSKDILNDLFHTDIIHFERKKWPALTGAQIASTDVVLHREYENKLTELRKQTKGAIENGAITADHLSTVEVAWEAYRDAWVAFARVRYPADVSAIRAEIVLERYRLVRTITAYE